MFHMGREPVYTRKPLFDDPCAHGTEETAAGSIYRRTPLWQCIRVKRSTRRRRLPRQSVLRVPPPSFAFFLLLRESA
jgi:hypothetical protein